MQLYENKAVSGTQFDVQTVLFKRYYFKRYYFLNIIILTNSFFCPFLPSSNSSENCLPFLPLNFPNCLTFSTFHNFVSLSFAESSTEQRELLEFLWTVCKLNSFEQFAIWTIFNLVCTKYSLAFFSSNKSQSGSKGKPIWTILSFSWIKGRRSKTVKCVWFVFHQC